MPATSVIVAQKVIHADNQRLGGNWLFGGNFWQPVLLPGAGFENCPSQVAVQPQRIAKPVSGWSVISTQSHRIQLSFHHFLRRRPEGERFPGA